MSEFNLCITLDTDADPVFENHKNSTTFRNLDSCLENLSKNISLIEIKLDKRDINPLIKARDEVHNLAINYYRKLHKNSLFKITPKT